MSAQEVLMAARVEINGVVYEAKNKVTLVGGKVIVDGQDMTPDSKQITINVVGYLRNLNVDFCRRVDVQGKVGTLYLGEACLVGDDLARRR